MFPSINHPLKNFTSSLHKLNCVNGRWDIKGVKEPRRNLCLVTSEAEVGVIVISFVIDSSVYMIER